LSRVSSLVVVNRTGIALLTGIAASLAAFGGSAAQSSVARAGQQLPAGGVPPVRVSLRPSVIDLYHSTSVRVSGAGIENAQVRLLGAIDRTGPAYKWTPYRWHRLRPRAGTLRAKLPAPALFGIYRLELRSESGRRFLSSTRRLLRVFPSGMTHRSYPTPVGAVRAFVADLPGDHVPVALRRWPRARFDHRDPRLHRIFVIAYAPRGDDRPGSRLGAFVTTVRDGYRGRWRLLNATTEPYDER
jgi:hypothetical protein